MPSRRSRPVLVLVALFLPMAARADAEGPLAPEKVPDPLRPWVDWVLRGQQARRCPLVLGDARATRCAWPSRLSLALDEKGGRFNLEWHVDVKGWYPLPGDAKRWPQEVMVGKTRATVVARDGARQGTAATGPSGGKAPAQGRAHDGGVPSVQLPPGDHVVSGRFAWDSLPEVLQIPAETALLRLTVKGVTIERPNRQADGRVFLQKTAAASESERLEIVVHRKIVDDNPLRLVTRVLLQVAGKNRELLLGRTLPPGFVPMALETPLPARLESDSRLRLQVRPGAWEIEITARAVGPVSALSRPAPDGPWRQGEEVWVFEAVSALRLVAVEGVTAIDPQQTSLPDAWKKLPAYPMKLGDTLRLSEKRRGDSAPAPDRLSLSRTLWIDFDGRGLTASDLIRGELRRARRLEMGAPSLLGRVSVGGRDQFITHLDDPTRRGVELRPGVLELSADSRVDASPYSIPAVGWQQDFHQVSGELNLPPGWRLVHASGVDEVSGTWLRHWTLLEIFLAVLLAVGVARLWGVRWGLLALVSFALLFPERAAPKWIWIGVLVLEALVRALSDGRLRRWLSIGRHAVAVVLVLHAIPFLVWHVRTGVYPALERDRAVASFEAQPPAPTEQTAQQKVAGARQAAGEAAKEPEPPADKPAPDAQPSRAASTEWLARQRAAGRYGIQSNVEAYDPKAMVQTGPGRPRWDWHRFELRWSGPVERSQRLRLFLLSPTVNVILAFTRVALLVVLTLLVVPWRLARLRARGAATSLALVLALGALGAPGHAHAQTVPPREVLEELGARLLAPPDCSPACAASPRMILEVRPAALRARVEIAAAAPTAVPLPGNASQWVPGQVLIDGKPASGLARDERGTLWLLVPPGVHQVTVEGAPPERDSFQLALPLRPRHLEASTEGWSLEGLHEDGQCDSDLQLTRKSDGRGEARLQPGALPPFVRVERTLRIGLNWQVETRVTRLTPAGVAVVLEIPLLAGESVTTADVRVSGGKAQVNMGPGQSETSWRSVLAERSPVTLSAPRAGGWSELWRLDASPIWHAAPAGIPPIHAASAGQLPEWRPWPGETLKLTITRPAGVAGQTITIDQARYRATPGLRATDATLDLSVRSSLGAQHTITIPDGAVVESVLLGGTAQPVRQVGNKLTLALAPGAQQIRIAWREGRGVRAFYRVPAIDLGSPSVNVTVELLLSDARWTLLVGGPRSGPAVLFWSMLLVLLLVSIALGRVRWVPLRGWHWMLLAIGLSQVHILLAAVVVAWLLLLGWRDRAQALHPALFDARQIVIAVWTLVALTVIVIAVHEGLLGQPNMQIEGNDSRADLLRWFQDRAERTPAQPWALSVPLLSYRLAMLAWALWLAFALLRWLRWGWSAVGRGGLWQKVPSPPARRPPRPSAAAGKPTPAGAPLAASGGAQQPPAAAAVERPAPSAAAASEAEVGTKSGPEGNGNG